MVVRPTSYVPDERLLGIVRHDAWAIPIWVIATWPPGFISASQLLYYKRNRPGLFRAGSSAIGYLLSLSGQQQEQGSPSPVNGQMYKTS